jgi:hypothetical protein
MTDYAWPDALAPTSQLFYLQPHTGGSESPFTRQTKVYGLSAPRFICRIGAIGGQSGAGLRGKGGAIDGFLAKVGGRLNRILIYDYRRPWPSPLTGLDFDGGETFDGGEEFLDTLALGASLAAAAGATRMQLAGCTPSRLLARAGEYVGGDGRPHTLTDDVTSSPAGTANVDFRPALAADLAAGAATFWKVAGAFRLTSDDAGANGASVGELEQFDLEMVEDL